MNEGVMKEVVLEATGVTRAFRQGPIDLTVLQGMNLRVRAGERIAIIGASGSGKTTLLQILGGLDRPTAGIVKIAGSDIHSLDEKPGGERQRAAVARALVTNPRIVLADEPTGNLDGGNAESVFELMLQLNRELATSLIVVTHDRRLAARMDRVLELEAGNLLER